jgi:hypothetical protein
VKLFQPPLLALLLHFLRTFSRSVSLRFLIIIIIIIIIITLAADATRVLRVKYPRSESSREI